MSQAAGVVRAIAVVAALLAAGGLLYAGFVDDVLDRGDKVVDVSLKSKEARPTLQLGASGIALFAASGLAGFARPVRGRRWSPLLGLGLALVPAGLMGMTAFSVGRTSLTLALIVLGPSVITMAVACLVPRRDPPGLGRFLVHSWMATGFLLGLLLLALAGLELAEAAKPRVPWASVFAALALGTLLQLAARYVGMHGRKPTPVPDHAQQREVHDTDAIRAVAARLHPFVEEGRDADAYGTLAADLGAVGRIPAPAPPELPPGPPTLPHAVAGPVAALRAAAVALPVAVLVPVVGWPAALVAFGLWLPVMRKTLDPRKDPLPRPWWLAAALAMGLGGAWLGSYLTADGFDRLTWPTAAIAAAPYLVAGLASLRPRRPVGHIDYLRLEHARALGKGWLRQVRLGLGVAAIAVLVPSLLVAASATTGLKIQAVGWPLLLAVAGGGVLWALGALLCGPPAAAHRARLGQAHAARVQARAAAHRSFLTRLEMT